MKKVLLSLSLVLVSILSFAQDGPGGVGSRNGTSALKVWLDANDRAFVITSTGPVVTQWSDKSGNANHASNTSNYPSYVANQFNGNAAIYFNAGASNFLQNTGMASSAGSTPDVFMSLRVNSYSAQGIAFNHLNGYPDNAYMQGTYGAGSGFYNCINPGGIKLYTPNNKSLPIGQHSVVNVFYGLGLANQSILAVDGNYSTFDIPSGSYGTTTQLDKYVLGGYLPASMFQDFHSGEVIIFNTKRNNTQRLILENYLASKYNIGSIANDFYQGDTPGNGNYDLAVIGTGQQGASDNHTVSHSDGGLNITVASSITTGAYLFAGHNKLVNTVTSNNLSGAVLQRWDRDFYLDKTNSLNAGNTKLAFNFLRSGVATTPGVAANYTLLYRSTSGGTFSETTVANIAVVGNEVVFDVTDANLVNGYYTIGTKNTFLSGLGIQTNNALDFDGTNDAVTILDNNSLDFSTQYTFESWIYVRAYQYSTLISKFDDDGNNRGWMVNFGETGDNTKLCVTQDNTGAWTNPIQWNSGFTPVLNTWYHVAVTFDASLASNEIKLFVNGTLYSQTSWAYSITPSVANVYLGGYDNTGNGVNGGANSRFLNGILEEVRVWNTARTLAQIQNSYNQNLVGNETGLVAYYPFNQGIAGGTNTGLTTLLGLTTPPNNGTLQGPFALSGATSNWVSGVPYPASTLLGSSNILATLSQSPFQIATGDFNGDGNLDMATANQAGNNVSVFTGTGLGTFGAVANYPAGAGTTGIVTGDFNSDGKLDLISMNAGVPGNISVFTGSGTGTFGDKIDIATGPVRNAAVGDLNKDGRLDLVIANPNSSNFWLFTGTGTGNFGTPISFTLSAGSYFSTSIADLNKDGNLDVVAVNYTNNLISVRLGNGTGGFGSETPYPTGGATSIFADIADINQDSNLDILVASQGSSFVSVFTGTGTGTFGSVNNSLLTTPAQSLSAVIAKDINGDGRLDILASNAGGSNISILTSTGNGSFAPYFNINPGGQVVNLVSEDVNNDGKPDIISAVISTNSVSVILNTWSTPAPTFVSISNPLSVCGTNGAITANFTGSFLNYQWYKDGVSIAGANTVTLTSGFSGAYYVVASNIAGSATSTITTITACNNALQFNGNSSSGFTDNSVSVSNSSSDFNLPNFTFEAWVNYTGNNGANTIFSKGNGNGANNEYIFQIDGGVPKLYNGHPTLYTLYNSGFTIPSNTWTHVAASYNSITSILGFYVNGNLVNSQIALNFTTPTGAANNDFFIGIQGANCRCNRFNGQIDEARIWNVARTPNDIKENIYRTINGNLPGLVAAYNFNQGIGGGNNSVVTTLIDQAGGNHNGTLNSFSNLTLGGNTSNWVGSITTITGLYNFGAPFINLGTAPSVCTNGTSTYTITATGQGSFSYQWFRNGALLAGQTSANLNLTSALTSAAGTYLVQVSSIYGTSTSVGVVFPNCNNALDFDGGNDEVIVGNIAALNLTSNFTAEAWVYNRLNSTGSDFMNTIFSKKNGGGPTGWALFVNEFETTNGRLVFETTNGNYLVSTNTNSVPVNQWSHVAVSVNQGVVSMYINGVLVPSTWTGAFSAISSTVTFRIGNFEGASFYNNGIIDEARIWNISLSQQDIQNNLFKNISTATPGLVGYWDFNQGIPSGNNTTITSALDKSGNGSNGTLTNFTLNGGASNFISSAQTTIIGTYTFSAPSISGITSSQTVCSGVTIPLSVSVTGSGLGYQWFKNGVSIAGATASNVTLTSALTTSAGIYTVAITSLGGNLTSTGISLGVGCNNALALGNSNDFVNITNVTPFTSIGNQFSYEFWVKLNSITNNAAFFIGNNSFSWDIQTGGTIRGYIIVSLAGGNFTNSTSTLTIGNWTHVAYTYNNGSFNYYFNGIPAGSGTIPTGNITPPTQVGFGDNPQTLTNNIDAQLDEIRFWNIALSQADVQANFIKKPLSTTPGLIAYYDFDQGIPNSINAGLTSAIDKSAFANNGVLTNFSLSGSISNWVGTGSTISGTFAFVNPSISGNSTNQTVCSGVTLPLSVTATGTGLGYQWYKDNVLIPSATASIFTLTNVTSTSAGTYFVSVTGLGGSTTSSGISLGVGCNNALDFDGVKDFVQLPAATYFNDNTFTIEAWVFPRTLADQSRVVDFGNGPFSNNVYLSYTNTSSGPPNLGIYPNASGAQYTGSTILTPNQWVHLAVVVNGTNAQMYINGVLNQSFSNVISVTSINRTLNYIGNSNWGTPLANMQIDELRIWSESLSQQDINANRNRKPNGNEPSLLAYYDFDQGLPSGNNASITTLLDKSVNGYHGTITGFSRNGAGSNFVTASASSSTGVYLFSQTTILGVTSSQTVCSGVTLPLSVTATGSGLAYQWFRNNVLIAGATASTLTLSSVTTTSAGTYFVSVTGLGGSVTSTGIALIVNTITTITLQPTNATICGGNTNVFSVSAVGSGLTYLWSNGATTPTITVSGAGNYNATLSGTCGIAVSTTASLSVQTLSVGISASATSILSGQSVTLSGTGAQTYTFTGGVSNGVGFTPSTTSTYTVVGANSIGCIATSQVTITVTSIVPVITSFTPLSASVGSLVTINGLRFSSTPTNNIVFFGATRAIVQSGTASMLVVQVPVGATYDPITVLNTDNSLITYSNARFNMVFTPSKGTFVASDLAPTQSLVGNLSQQFYSIRAGDIDGDGKVDLVQALQPGNISVLRNNSSGNTLSFNLSTEFPGNYGTVDLQLGDLNGDGKLDVLAACANGGPAVYYINNSSPGTISFAAVVNLGSNSGNRGTGIADLNGDGKLDILTNFNETIELWRNTSASTSNVSFVLDYTLSNTNSLGYFQVADINNDGKLDIVQGDRTSTPNYSLNIFVNQHNGGAFSVSSFNKVAFSNGTDLGGHTVNLKLADFDIDGKMDVAVLGYSGRVHLFRNTTPSAGATPTFTPYVDYPVNTQPIDFEVGDLTGDGKVDIVVFNNYSFANGDFSILVNDGTVGTASFLPRVDFTPTANTAWKGTLGDLNGDGKLDIIFGNPATPGTVYSYLYSPSDIFPIISGVSPSNVFCEGSSIFLNVTASGGNLSYQWYKNTSILSSATTSGLSLSSLTTSASGIYTVVVSNSAGTITSNGINIGVTPFPVLSSISSNYIGCVGNTATLSVIGTNIGSYQWKKSGVDISGGTTSLLTLAGIVANTGNYTVSLANACQTITSSTVSVTIDNFVSITGISSSFSMCPNSTRIITISGAGGGGSVLFQWYKDGLPIAGANTLNYPVVGTSMTASGTYFLTVSALCGTATSAGANVNVYCNNALDFDGINDRVTNTYTTGQVPSGNQDWTFQTWVYYKGGQTGDRWFAWWGTAGAGEQMILFGINANSNTLKVHRYSGNNRDLSTPFPVLAWTQLSYAYTGATRTLKVYVNGVLTDVINDYSTNLNLPAASTFELGTFQSNNGFASNILMDEVRLFSVAFTDADVQRSLTTSVSSSTPNLAVYYDFNQGIASQPNTETQLIDNTSNPLNLNITNFTQTGSTSNWVASTVSFTGIFNFINPEINIKGNSTFPIASGDVNPSIFDKTDFGTVSGISYSTFIIENIGNGTLSLTGTPLVSISGSNDFVVSTLPSAIVTSATSTAFTIGFIPSTPGLKTANVIIKSNDSDEGTYLFSIKGVYDCGIANQTLVASNLSICGTGMVSLSLTGSELGKEYFLRNNADNSILGGSISGTGGALSFGAISISTTTSFNVLGTISGSCSLQISAPIIVTVLPLPSLAISGTTCINSGKLSANYSDTPSSLSWSYGGNVFQINTVFGLGSTLTNLAGIGGGAGAALNQMNQPTDVAYGADGALYISDTYNHRIMRYAPGATTGTIAAGGNGQGTGLNQLNTPYSVAFDGAGNLYVADRDNSRVMKYPPNSTSATNGTAIVTGAGNPSDIVITSANEMFVSFMSVVRKYNTSGVGGSIVAGTGTSGSALTQINNAICIAVDASNNVYCSEANNSRVTKWASGATTGVIVAGTGMSGAALNQIADSRGIAVDGQGNLYVADGSASSYAIKKWNAGSVGGDNSTVLPGTASNLFVPFGLTFAPDGSLVVADYNNNRIRSLQGANTGILPTVAGVYTANYTNTQGCTAIANKTVNDLPTVTGIISPNTVCSGQLTLPTGNGALTSTYEWSGGLQNNTAFAPTISGIYTVFGTGTGGCLGSGVVSVTVLALPTVTGLVSKNPVCIGESATLTGLGATTFMWQTPEGAIFNTSSILVTPTATGTYFLQGTAANNCIANAQNVTVTVNALPVITFKPFPNSIDLVCVGQPASLSAQGANTFTFTGGIMNGSQFTPSSSTTYTVSGTDNFGCIGTVIKTVTVIGVPTVTGTISPSNEVCFGTIVTISGNGANTYSISGGVLNTIPFVATTSGIYTITGLVGSGCQNFSVITLTVNQLPVVTANVSSPNVCAGQSVTFAGSGALSFSWTNGVVNGASFIPIITNNYTVTGTDANGCSNTATRNLIVNPLPSISISTSSLAFCPGGSVMLTATGAGGGGGYSWSTGALSSIVSLNPINTTVYSVTGADNKGCENVASVTITQSPSVELSPVINQITNYGSNYSSTLAVTGAGVNFSVTSGVLPTGLALNSITGLISGIPSVLGQYNFTILADNGSCSDSKSFGIKVDPAPLTVVAKDTSVYQFAPFPSLSQFRSSISGLAFGETLNISYFISTNNTNTIGNYIINPVVTSGTANLNNYILTTISGSFNVISPLPLIVSAKNEIREYGNPDPAFVGTVTGIDPQFPNIIVNYYTTTNSVSGFGTYPILASLSGIDAFRYSLVSNTVGGMTVRTRRLIVRTFDFTIAHGQPKPTEFPTTIIGLLSGSLPKISFSTELVPGETNKYNIIPEIEGIDLNLYSLVLFPGILTERPGITIIGNNFTKTYGQPNPILTGAISGINPAEPYVYVSFQTSATPNSPVGEYTVYPVISGSDASKYGYVTVLGVLTVTKANLSVAAANQVRPSTLTSAFSFTPVITGAVNGDIIPVDFTTDAPDLSTTGTYLIYPSVSGIANVNYNVTTFTGTLTIATVVSPPISITITAGNFSRKYGEADGIYAYTTNGTINSADNITVSLQSNANSNSPIGSYTLTPIISGLDTYKYDFTTVAGTLTIQKNTVRVAALDYSRGYGDANPPFFNASVSGLLNGDQLNAFAFVNANQFSGAGGYDVYPQILGAIPPNYDVVTIAGRLTINKAVLTLIGGTFERMYNQPNPSLAYNIIGYKGADQIGMINRLPIGQTIATLNTPVANTPYPVIYSGGSDNNYDFVYQEGSIKINPSTQTITGYNPIARVKTGESVTLSAYATSGLPIQVTSKDTNVVKNKDLLMNGKSDGQTYILLKQPGDANYLAADSVLIAITSQSTGIKPTTLIGIFGSNLLFKGVQAEYQSTIIPNYRYSWSYRPSIYVPENINWVNPLDTTTSKVKIVFPSNINVILPNSKDSSRVYMGDIICKVYDDLGNLMKINKLQLLLNVDEQAAAIAQLAQTLAVLECPPAVTNCTKTFISTFNYGKRVNVTDKECNGGFSDFTASGKIDTLVMGNPYNFKIGATVAVNTSSLIFFAIWIDYDNNGSFNDPDDFLRASSEASNLFEIDNLTIRNNDKYEGPRRIRISMKTSKISPNESCLAEGVVGETEDYMIYVKKPQALEAASLVTPNADEKNDFFVIRGMNAKNPKKLLILDRWGTQIYKTDDYQNDWDGKDGNGKQVSDGTYYYYFDNGTDENNNQLFIKGFLELKTK